MLAVAAVIGREFALATLEAVAGVSEEELAVALEEAVRTAVLEERAGPGSVRYRFTHAFFRQTLYEELIAPRRLRLHQQVAQALETQYAGRLDDHAAELAEHFAQSSEPEALTKAVAFGERAVQRATQVYAHGEAARLLDGALAVQEVLDPHDTARRCDLLLALAEALLAAGEQERVGKEVLSEAFALAEALRDRRRALAACEMGPWAVPHPGTGPAYGDWVERLDRYADPDTNARVLADAHLASVAEIAGRLTEGWTVAARGYALVQRLAQRGVGHLDQFYFSAGVFTNIGLLTGHGEETVVAAEAIAAAPRAGVSARHLSIALMLAANALLAAGDRERAEPLWQEVVELGERTQDAVAILMGERNVHPTIALLDGRFDDVLERTAPRRAAWDRAAALAYLGRDDEALTLPPRLPDDLADGHEEHYALRSGAAVATRALRLARSGDLAAAEAILRRFAALRGLGPASETNIVARAELLETATLVGDREAVALLAMALAPERHRLAVELGFAVTGIARHLGAAAALLGQHREAREYYATALEVTAKTRFRPEAALTRLQLAELLLAHFPQDRDEAGEHLEIAIAEFRAMGMTPALERALALEAELGRAAARARPSYPDGLSEREVEVLRLLAAGKSNRDIAEALVIAPGTAARHISNIFTKIGTTNRTEASRYAADHGLT